ncbi:MAG TPA: tetratricopeptide repeat protein [Coleofasciculaceae cyanobacterium]
MSEPDRIRRWAIVTVLALLLGAIVQGFTATTPWAVAGNQDRSSVMNSVIDPMVLGAAAFAQDDYPAALRAFATAATEAATPHGQAIAYGNRCRVWLAVEDWPAAIEDCDRSIALQPQQSAAYLHRGLAWRGQKDLVRADQDFSQALRFAPTDGRAWYNRGLTRAEQQQPVAAIADFDRAAVQFGHGTLGPLAQVYYDRALTWLELRNFSQALADLDRVVRHNPANAEAFHARGSVLQALGQSDRALASFDQAIALAPMNGPSYVARGRLHQQRHCSQAAIADLECAARCFYECGDLAAYQSVMLALRQLQSSRTAIG